jgi:hypothetical protein
MSYPTSFTLIFINAIATLFFGDHLISSSVGAQQGDPCGPMIFSLAIQQIN